MNVTITGRSGFIGSNLVRLVFAERFRWPVVSLDKLTYAGNAENLSAPSSPKYAEHDGWRERILSGAYREYYSRQSGGRE